MGFREGIIVGLRGKKTQTRRKKKKTLTAKEQERLKELARSL